MSSRSSRVRHPVLRLDVLRADGTVAHEDRVFCRYQRRSVPAGSCHGCAHCDAITGGPDPAIICTIPLSSEDLTSDPTGDRTEVGAVLREGTVAIDPAASIGDALAILRTENRRSVAVVDERHALVGVVHEIAFVRAAKPAQDVGAAMSSALALHESTSVHRALRLLASAHLREATVIADDGHPIGIFRDVDGLRWIAHARASHSVPPARRDERDRAQ